MVLEYYHYMIAKFKASRGNQNRLGCFASIGCASHDYHGDDAVGYGPNYMVVADGVSGTQKASGILARVLVSETLTELEKLRRKAMLEPIKATDFRNGMVLAIKDARNLTRRKGRFDSTITAVYFDESTHQMYVYNIGDCKCILVRNNSVVFESDSIVYDFNVPAVVSTNAEINYSMQVEIQSFPYQKGDVCMVFSDGVHDNLYVDQVLEVVEANNHNGSNGSEIAHKTVKQSKDTFDRLGDYIPFAISASGFCQNAIDEMKSNTSISKQDFDTFALKCQQLPKCSDGRAIFGKEKRVKHIAFYSASNLLTFASKKMGKKDDISVCAGIVG